MTRPSSVGPTGTVSALPRGTIGSPGRMPVVSPSGTESRRPSRKPTTSTGSGAPRPVRTSQISPTLAAGPFDSMSRPTTRATWPTTGAVSTVESRAMYRSSGNPISGASPGATLVLRFLAEQRTRQLADLRIDADVDRAERRPDETAAARHRRIRTELDRVARIDESAARDDGVIVGIEVHGRGHVLAQPIDGHARHDDQQLAVEIDLAPLNPSGHRHGEPDEVSLGPAHQHAADVGEVLESLGQPRCRLARLFDGGGRSGLACGALAVGVAAGVGFALDRLEPLGRWRRQVARGRRRCRPWLVVAPRLAQERDNGATDAAARLPGEAIGG